MPRVRRTAIGCHIYAGGFTCGIKQAGFDVLAHLESLTYGNSSARLNWPSLPIHVPEDEWPLRELAKKKIDLVYCNPPCAIFSTAGAGRKVGWQDDPRLDCWRQCFKVFTELSPRVFVLESVIQAFTKGRSNVNHFAAKAMELGYSCSIVLLDSQWTGIPQSRRRFLMVFYDRRIDLEFSFSFKEAPTVREVLKHVKSPGFIEPTESSTRVRIIKKAKPGEKLRVVFDRTEDPKRGPNGKIKHRPSFLAYRLPLDKVTGAFAGGNRIYVHPTEDRYLGVNEMKAICGYPLDFKLNGNPLGHSSLLARAVLPPVGKWIGQQVKIALDKPKLSRTQTKYLLFDLRQPGMPVEELEA